MRVIFLDIDGVLATHKEYMMNRTKFRTKNPDAERLRIPYPFNPGCVKVFNEIIEEINPTIILSSDWRIHWDLDELNEIFKFNGVIKSPEGRTGVSKKKLSSSLEDDRVWQIKNYLEGLNDVESWVAIDDLNLSDLKPNFIQTNDFEGIKQLSIKKKVIDILKPSTKG